MRTILSGLGLVLVLVGAVAAQVNAPSVFTYTFGQGSGEGKSAASKLENQIGIGLLNQFPCVDQMDFDSAVSILDLERKRQLLTGEPNDDLLQNIASSIGATYLIVIKTIPMGDGKTFVSIKVLDTRTGRAVANRVGDPASGNALLDVVDSLTNQILQDIASLLKGRCTPRWSGTITLEYKYETKEEKTETFPGGDKSKNTRSYISLWRTENFIHAMLNSREGEDPNRAKAVVVHRFTHRDEHIVNENEAAWCRPKAGNSFWKRLSNRQSDIGDEQGEARSNETVWVNIDKTNGTFTISVKYPAVTTTSHREITATGIACFDAKPSSAISNGEGSPESGAYTIEGIEKISGEIDPKNPDVLVGHKTTGDKTSGIHTVTWNLRLLKPKSSR